MIINVPNVPARLLNSEDVQKWTHKSIAQNVEAEVPKGF